MESESPVFSAKFPTVSMGPVVAATEDYISARIRFSASTLTQVVATTQVAVLTMIMLIVIYIYMLPH